MIPGSPRVDMVRLCLSGLHWSVADGAYPGLRICLNAGEHVAQSESAVQPVGTPPPPLRKHGRGPRNPGKAAVQRPPGA